MRKGFTLIELMVV
ncbi:prepilin-type N-terminal cleavage/methylation domain-containing protein, partial [candidate division WOR-3 bacterium]|nr:prepilin-type N-terminal cleavage/methylation domain-containing protein [candidate division WOR-3 bacterium]